MRVANFTLYEYAIHYFKLYLSLSPSVSFTPSLFSSHSFPTWISFPSALNLNPSMDVSTVGPRVNKHTSNTPRGGPAAKLTLPNRRLSLSFPFFPLGAHSVFWLSPQPVVPKMEATPNSRAARQWVQIKCQPLCVYAHVFLHVCSHANTSAPCCVCSYVCTCVCACFLFVFLKTISASSYSLYECACVCLCIFVLACLRSRTKWRYLCAK